MSYNSTKLLKTLIAEDNLIDRKQLERLLSKSTLPPFEIKHAEYLENALALPNTDDFDIAIPDLNPPDSNSLYTAGGFCANSLAAATHFASRHNYRTSNQVTILQRRS